MESYTVKPTSRHSADIEEPLVLNETQTTRRIFKLQIVDNVRDDAACVRGFIIHQRKSNSSVWENINSINLATLKSGEGVKLELSSQETKLIYEKLKELYLVGKNGIPFEETKLIVAAEDQIIQIEGKRREFIQRLINEDYSDEMWEEISAINPQIADHLALSRIHTSRLEALNEFEASMSKDLSESYWQNFFNNNQWIFGYGLKYCFLNTITGQPYYGDTNLRGKGAQRGDYLLNSESEAKFTVLVEIKRPDTKLVEQDYQRNGTWKLSSDLVWSISQLQVNCRTWELDGSRSSANTEELEHIYTCQPKGILVIGNCSQLDRAWKRNTFELYRRNLFNPEVVTFDELYQRAKFIVYKSDEDEQVGSEMKNYQSKNSNNVIDDELPF